MAIATKISDYMGLAYELLPQQFKDKPIIDATLKTWTGTLQDVEDDVFDLMNETLFLNAKGKNLERYGNLLNIRRPDGMSDESYRELLIGEILKRSSDGTPDRIRQILEATLGLKSTKYFEHINENQLPTVMGCIMIYGFSDKLELVDNTQAKYLKAGSPITTGSTVLGSHAYTRTNLFIPSEIIAELDRLGTHDKDFIVTGTDDFIALKGSTYSQYGTGYRDAILPELGILDEQFQVDYNSTTEDLVVETNQGVEENFHVQYFNVLKPTVRDDHGIMLEISQLNLDEDI